MIFSLDGQVYLDPGRWASQHDVRQGSQIPPCVLEILYGLTGQSDRPNTVLIGDTEFIVGKKKVQHYNIKYAETI